LQDVYLFSGTIESNINMDNSEISREKVIDAAKTVGADKFIADLPQKYGEEVKERGATLSVGQKQLISFARALAYNPKILILDDPTRGIDVGTKYEIYNLINKLSENGVGIIMISSELEEVLGMSDRIMVMREGECAGILNRKDATQERIMALATNLKRNDRYNQ